MYETHYYTLHKACPCKIGDEAVQAALDIYKTSNSVSNFIDEMEQRRIIGKRIWYDGNENTIFILK